MMTPKGKEKEGEAEAENEERSDDDKARATATKRLVYLIDFNIVLLIRGFFNC